MITAKDHINLIRQEAKDLMSRIKRQRKQAGRLNMSINPMGTVALNKTKVVIVAWYETALAIYEANKVLIDTRISAKEHEDDEVICDNSDFGKFSLTGEPIHRKWMVAKDKHQDSLVFIRDGSFYKTYAGDAFRFSEALGHRASIQICDKYNVLMIRFPVHTITNYSRSLMEKGFKVEVVD